MGFHHALSQGQGKSSGKAIFHLNFRKISKQKKGKRLGDIGS
jgi:hypothetical protein